MIEKDFATFLASAKPTVSLKKVKYDYRENREFLHSVETPPNQ